MRQASQQQHGGILLIQQPRCAFPPRFRATFSLLPQTVSTLSYSTPPSYQVVAAAPVALLVSEGLLGLNCELCGEFLGHAARIRSFHRLQPACAAAGCSVGLVHLSDEWTSSATWYGPSLCPAAPCAWLAVHIAC